MVNVNSGSIDNQSQFTVNGTLSVNGTLPNSGRRRHPGHLNVNSGGVDNTCTITVSGSVTLNPAGNTNSGQWLIAGDFTDERVVDSRSRRGGHVQHLTLNGDITGSGAIRIEGSSLQNGSSAVTGTPRDQCL